MVHTREYNRLKMQAIQVKLKRRAFVLVAVQVQMLTRSRGSSSPITLHAAHSASPQAAKSAAAMPMSKRIPILTAVCWDLGAPCAGLLVFRLLGGLPPLKRTKHVALVASQDTAVRSKLQDNEIGPLFICRDC